jgi:hypothetical protein
MEYKCKICNKDYKSYQSLWNHNKKFHNGVNTVGNGSIGKSNGKVTESDNKVTDLVTESDNKVTDLVTESNGKCITSVLQAYSNIDNKSLLCKYCNKLFKYKQNKYEHEKKVCKSKNIIEEENKIRERYGLKNKREIWKAEAAIVRIRNLAKKGATQKQLSDFSV